MKLICIKKKGPRIDTAVDICRSLIYGTLSHGITIYGCTIKFNINRINISLNYCFRTVTGLLIKDH